MEGILQQNAKVFKDEFCQLKRTAVKIHIDFQATPRFFRPRKVPYAVLEKLEKALSRLQETGVISPVQFSDLAARIVPVTKSDGSIRVYMGTINLQ